MKIIYYSPHPNLNLSSPSGPGTHMREVIKGFENQGHEVIPCILGGTEETGLEIEYAEGGFKKFIKKLLPESIWQTAKDIRLRRFDKYAREQLKAIVDKENPDMIYERGYYLMTSGVEVAKEEGVAHAIELNAPYPEEKVQMEGASMFVSLAHEKEKVQVTETDLVVVVSSALKTYLADKHEIDNEKILVTPNAVNPEKFRGVASGKAQFSEEHTVIGFVGSIFPYHGVDMLIQGFAELSEKNENLRLLIVGDGYVLSSLKQLAEELRVSDKVIFTGNVAYHEVYTLIAEMDICVMATSNWYGSPVKIFEYGIMNKAIIAPDNIPVKDVMVHEEDGLLCEASRISLTNGLRRLIQDSELRLRLASNFHDKVLKEHTWTQVSERILKHMPQGKNADSPTKQEM
jgi:glycosyltransferase involved in cell wall biosynthesis